MSQKTDVSSEFFATVRQQFVDAGLILESENNQGKENRMKYKKVIGLVVAIVCALASIWVGAWLTGSVFRYGDWQHFPALATCATFAVTSGAYAFKLFIDWATE